MTFNATGLLLASFAYLVLLFGIAWATEQSTRLRTWVRHPLVYTLSLGVFAGIWAIYGSVGMAVASGYDFIAYYLGISVAFLLAPVLLNPILRISRAHQLTSLADLFAFRYRSQWAGTLVTLCSGAAILALLSMQIQAVSLSASLMVIMFTILFGARGQRNAGNNEGLVLAIAFDSVVKMVALLVLGGVIVFSVLGGIGGLQSWFTFEPSINPGGDGSWRALALMSFASALVLPHMYHMTFAENPPTRGLTKASWGLPLYLLLVGLPIPLIAWGGQALAVNVPPAFFRHWHWPGTGPASPGAADLHCRTIGRQRPDDCQHTGAVGHGT